MRIIIDAMGGDNAPEATVKGAVYARDRLGVEIVLVGRKEEIEKYLGEDGSGISIVDARDVITMEDDPSTATRRKKDASMTVALNMLKNGEGDAMVSAGSTGALLSGATLIVRRIRGRSPRGHGAGAAQPRERHNAHRLRRKRRVYAGISSSVRIYGQLLCPQNDGSYSAASRTSQHRRGGD